MKKSKVAIGVIAVLGIAWVGGAWFTGQTAETEYKRQIERANQQFQSLKASNSFNVVFKNKQFERGWFRSQVEDELVISLPQTQQQWTIPLSTTLYHGPFPLNQLAKLNLMPAMFAAEGFIAKNESTQPLFDLMKSDKPIQYRASTGYGLSTKGSLSFAAGEWRDQENDQNKLLWSGVKMNFNVNQDLSGHYDFAAEDVTALFDWEKEIDETPFKSLKVQWKGIKFNSDFAPTKWTYIYTGKGGYSVDALEMTRLDREDQTASFIKKGLKSTAEVNLESDFVNLKSTSSIDSVMSDHQDLGKVTYNLELNHFEGNAVNAFIETLMSIFNEAKGDNANAVAGQLLQNWVLQHGLEILNNQPQVKLNPMSISDEQGKLSLDLNVALAPNPTFKRGNLYKQFKDFSLNIWLDKATAENILAKLPPREDRAAIKAQIEEFALEGEKNGFAVNSEKSVSVKLMLENGELKLNGKVIPEEQAQGIIFMLLMGAVMPR
ncbi:YdgA family protein [Rodentibacter myodis]|uniref:DUF945 domain-containing protein n=1 Tax=Rodentibacter myodis TaxID=1907939 RepID=A0A1V3JQ33_9PAST|nr:YdgA family protein [Rodentibacter myodis]OOF58509.1 hypothetical protein BKL49_07075 [Rodentibacter myodis]